MKICDVCLKEEVPSHNERLAFGLDLCDTCANKIYENSQQLKEQYRQEQIKKPIKTSEIKRIGQAEPKENQINLQENLELKGNV